MPEHKNMSVVQTTEMTKQAPMLANMYQQIHQSLEPPSIPYTSLDVGKLPTHRLQSIPTACSPGKST